MQGIKELLEDARKAIGAYLNRGNTDGIIVVLIKKYHDFLTDDERLALIDPQEQEVKSLGHDFSCRFTTITNLILFAIELPTWRWSMAKQTGQSKNWRVHETGEGTIAVARSISLVI